MIFDITDNTHIMEVSYFREYLAHYMQKINICEYI